MDESDAQPDVAATRSTWRSQHDRYPVGKYAHKANTAHTAIRKWPEDLNYVVRDEAEVAGVMRTLKDYSAMPTQEIVERMNAAGCRTA